MHVLSLEKTARRENLAELFAFVEQALASLNTPASNRDKLMMSLDEALTNVVFYAYPENRPGTVGIRIFRDGQTVTAEIVDHGKPFDPTMHPPPDITLPIEQRPVGGLGIHMMRELLTGLHYCRENGENRLVLTSRWGDADERCDPVH